VSAIAVNTPGLMTSPEDAANRPWATRVSIQSAGLARARELAAAHELVQGVFEAIRRPQYGGRIEQMVFDWLSQRERAIASLLCAPPLKVAELTWAQRWQSAARTLVVLLIFLSLVPLAKSWRWIAFAPVLWVSMPLIGGSWSGHRLSGESLSPATLPISIREMTRIVVLVNRVQLLMWLPALMAGFSVAAWKSDVGMGTGVIWGAKAAYVAIVLQPLVFLAKNSERAQDRSHLLRALATVVVFVILVVVLITSGIMFFQPDWMLTICGAVGLLVVSQIAIALDCRRYERGPLDLAPAPDVSQYGSVASN
jgi:hypothetical protein